MAADECGQSFGASSLHRFIADVKGDDRFVALMRGARALDNGEAAGEGEVGLGGFEWVDFYGSFVEPAMSAFGFLFVDKKGEPSAF